MGLKDTGHFRLKLGKFEKSFIFLFLLEEKGEKVKSLRIINSTPLYLFWIIQLLKLLYFHISWNQRIYIYRRRKSKAKMDVENKTPQWKRDNSSLYRFLVSVDFWERTHVLKAGWLESVQQFLSVVYLRIKLETNILKLATIIHVTTRWFSSWRNLVEKVHAK